MKFCGLAVGFALSAAASAASQPDYVLVQTYETSFTQAGSSSGSASGRTALTERVIAQSADGTEIEYSIPQDPADARGSAIWMYPARVLIGPNGDKRVLNAQELDARVDEWLASVDWTRDACSRWLFTWTAVQIRCDPAAVIEVIEANDMRPGTIAEGALLDIPGYGISAYLREAGTRGNRRLFIAEAELDSDWARRKGAEVAVAVAEMNGETLAFEDALIAEAEVETSGTIRIEFEVDDAGLVWGRTSEVEELVIKPSQTDELRRMRSTVTRFTYDDWASMQETPL
jgi:hypothetical protein